MQGFPTIKAIVGGKAKNYQGAREAGPMKDWILQVRDKRGSKGGSNKCYKGIFKSKVYSILNCLETWLRVQVF